MTRFALTLLLTSVAAAQNCGVQQESPWPAGIDPNSYPANPQTGQPLLVLHTTAHVGQHITIDCNACDPEGDPMTVWREDTKQQISLGPGGAFALEFTADEPRTVVIPIGVSDGLDQNTVIGLYAVTFTLNRPPILAGSVRQSGNVSAVKQKELQIAAKRGVNIASGSFAVLTEPD